MRYLIQKTWAKTFIVPVNRNGDRNGDRSGDRNGDRNGDPNGDRNGDRNGECRSKVCFDFPYFQICPKA